MCKVSIAALIAHLQIAYDLNFQWGTVIGITQPHPKEGAWRTLFSNLSKSGLDNYVVKNRGFLGIFKDSLLLKLLTSLDAKRTKRREKMCFVSLLDHCTVVQRGDKTSK